ncbi:MAG: hypothetical protein AMQ74_01991 [Candidatus Methanofastidiosum methylothiophilum]|uniref:4Fe-4S ferredoxin-type domain-containing protein n=1 Tax=Candidatus Methanofastidiosum methylothiophilum TaxID=1705564 RepID=A0A150IH70_9EURY|nr:MAG: hypothetical protein AMQ74_01991 [Candidatus Methanofastidiosum methylthiophilus]
MYMVTRQLNYFEGPIVEVTRGGLDGVNPDALVEKYKGEFEQFSDPREAVKVALSIREQWSKDIEGLPNEEYAVASIRDKVIRDIAIGCGNTCGGDCPLEAISPEEAEAWAVKEYNALKKCARCNDIVKTPYTHEYSEEEFCSEYCTEEDLNDIMEGLNEGEHN